MTQGLKETGYVEGQNVAMESRYTEADDYGWLPAMLADLVHRQASVIATGGAAPTVAAKTASTTIPIV